MLIVAAVTVDGTKLIPILILVLATGHKVLSPKVLRVLSIANVRAVLA